MTTQHTSIIDWNTEDMKTIEECDLDTLLLCLDRQQDRLENEYVTEYYIEGAL